MPARKTGKSLNERMGKSLRENRILIKERLMLSCRCPWFSAMFVIVLLAAATALAGNLCIRIFLQRRRFYFPLTPLTGIVQCG